MRDHRSRGGAANLGVPLMVVTFVLMGGFLYWLNIQAPATQVVIEEEGPVEEAGIEAVDVTVDQLGGAIGSLEGQVVRITGLSVAQAVGTEAFFLDVPQSPLLVKLDSTLVARGMAVPTGVVSVAGTVTAVNDSIVTAWVDAGAIGEGERVLVEFSTHFLDAAEIRGPGVVMNAPPAADSSGAGGDGGDDDGNDATSG